MARAMTPTLLSLDQYAQVMGINLFEFNQVGSGLPLEKNASCESVWYQYPWQKDFLSREELAQAISSAEELLAHQLKFWPAPKYIVNEKIEPKRPRDHGLPSMLAADGFWKPIALEYSYIQDVGILSRVLLDASASVTYMDLDGDGFDESFTISIITANVEQASQIGIYYTEIDRLSAEIDETWRIRPVKVRVNGTTITITGSKAQVVLPSKNESFKPSKLSALDVSNFVTDVEVYRVFTDSTATEQLPNQGIGSWDPPPGCDTADCGVQTAPICLANWGGDSGIVKVQIKEEFAKYSWWPDRFNVNYLSGIPLTSDGKVNYQWARVIAYLATTLLPSEKCGCERSNAIIRWWRMLPNQGSGEDIRPITLKEIDENPFGPRRGGRYAWQYIKDMIADGISH